MRHRNARDCVLWCHEIMRGSCVEMNAREVISRACETTQKEDSISEEQVFL
jgi:hypothetical protein